MTSPVLILIPVYNGERTLAELIVRIRQTVPDLSILIVNDGSTDSTQRVAESAGTEMISFSQNQGKGAALRAGFKYAIEHGFGAVVTLDCDLQHLPEEIPRFLDRNDGKSILMGTREIARELMPFGRWVSNNWTSSIVSIFSSRRVRDSQSGYRSDPGSGP